MTYYETTLRTIRGSLQDLAQIKNHHLLRVQGYELFSQVGSVLRGGAGTVEGRERQCHQMLEFTRETLENFNTRLHLGQPNSLNEIHSLIDVIDDTLSGGLDEVMLELGFYDEGPTLN